MGKRTYSDIGKFKRVEAALREAANSFRTALEEIDKALAGKRTDDELALLRSIRDQTAKLRDDARTVAGRFFSETQEL